MVMDLQNEMRPETLSIPEIELERESTNSL